MQVEDPTADCQHEHVKRDVIEGIEEWRCVGCYEPFTREKELAELAQHADLLNSRIVALDDELSGAKSKLDRIRAVLDSANSHVAMLIDVRNVIDGDPTEYLPEQPK